jgi:hypothetical protein
MFSIKSFSIDSLLAGQRRPDVVSSNRSGEHSSKKSGDAVASAEVGSDVVEMEEGTSASLCSNEKLSDFADDCCSNDSQESVNDDWLTTDDATMKSVPAAESASRGFDFRSRSKSSGRVVDDTDAMDYAKNDVNGCSKTLRTFGNLLSTGFQIQRQPHQHLDVGFHHSTAKPHLLPAAAAAAAQLRPVSEKVLSAALSTDMGASAFRSPPMIPSIDNVVAQNQNAGSTVVEMADSMLQRLAAQHRLQQHVEWLRRAAGCGVYIPRMLDFSGMAHILAICFITFAITLELEHYTIYAALIICLK